MGYPEWLKQRFSTDGTRQMVRSLLQELALTTVCEEALCPNWQECWGQRQVTFMILGDRCTRSCRFCAVAHGRPRPVDATEPDRVAEAVKRLALVHVVITSVARDDLADEGAGQFVRVIEAVRVSNPGITVEVLVPDFHGRVELITRVMSAQPDVFAHNVETVERLSTALRPQADYRRSLGALRVARELSGTRIVKSSLMLGCGEQVEEMQRTFEELLAVGCTHLTLGQYLRPTPQHLPVVEHLSPERFAVYESLAYHAGFQWVRAGPFVRSSYHAVDALVGRSEGN